jgi:hypothetical protein
MQVPQTVLGVLSYPEPLSCRTFCPLFDVSPLLEAQEVLRRAEGIGFVHCTNDTPPNEWDTLPAYWEEWVELFRQPLYYVP